MTPKLLVTVLLLIATGELQATRGLTRNGSPDPTETELPNGDSAVTTELAMFLSAKSDSEAEARALKKIEERKPRAQEVKIAIRDALRKGHAANLKPGITHDQVFHVDGVQLSASVYIPQRVDSPAALWVIPAHPTYAVNDDKTFQLLLNALPKDAIILFVNLANEAFKNPDGPVGVRYGRGVRRDRQRVIDYCEVFAGAIAMALRRFPVDPDRVYGWGVSAGGNAMWWNGVRLPDVFAGIVPCDTNPIQVIPWMASLQQMRVAILHGEQDRKCPVVVLRKVDKRLQQIGVETKYMEVDGVGQGQTWIHKTIELCTWAEGHTRNSRPEKFAFFPDKSGDRCFWVEAIALAINEPSKRPPWGNPPAAITASVNDSGIIDLTTRGVSRVRIWLNEKAVASVRINQVDGKHQPVLCLRDALLHVKSRQDPNLFRMWAIDIDVPARTTKPR